MYTKLEKLKETAERRTILAMIVLIVMGVVFVSIVDYFLGAIVTIVSIFGLSLIYTPIFFVLIDANQSPLYKKFRMEEAKTYIIEKYNLKENTFVKTKIKKYNEELDVELSVFLRLVSENEVEVIESKETEVIEQFTIRFCDLISRYHHIILM